VIVPNNAIDLSVRALALGTTAHVLNDLGNMNGFAFMGPTFAF